MKHESREDSFMTTGIKTSIAAGVAALTLAVAAPVFVAAQQDQQPQNRRPGFGGPPPGGGPGMMGPRRGPGGPFGLGPGMRELDLSDDQKAQLKQIAESHRDEFKAAGEKARAAHDGMQALIEADQIDENAIRAKSQEIAAAEAEVMILNAKVRQQSMQVLTSEQQAKLKELRAQRPGPRGQGGPRERRPQGQQQKGQL
jgi:Spy/CpxP family protein refolding chaperone